jgi:hypothetical protein
VNTPGFFPRIGRPLKHTRNRLYPIDTPRRSLIAKSLPDHGEARAEAAGHRLLREWYPVPALHHHVRLPRRSVLVYDRLPGGPDRGLLLDLLNIPEGGDHAVLDAYMQELTATYARVFAKTAELSPPEAVVGKLYRERAAPGGRLDRYYAGGDLPLTDTETRPTSSDLARTGLYVNERHYKLDWEGTRAWLRDAFDTPVWSAISQGDPTDVNLAAPLAWLDYDTAGRNAIAGEIANFSFHTAVLGGWLVPLLNPQAFARHPATFDRISANTPRISAHLHGGNLDIRFTDRLSATRRLALDRYWELLVHPIAARHFPGESLAQALRPYLAMRVIGVFDLAHMTLEQRLYLLAKLALCTAPDFSPQRFFGLVDASCPIP